MMKMTQAIIHTAYQWAFSVGESSSVMSTGRMSAGARSASVRKWFGSPTVSSRRVIPASRGRKR